jgi:hypothetical protein
MSIAIGLVLHESHRAIFAEAARTLSGVQLEWVVYQHEDQIRPRAEELFARQRVDGLLLGLVPYAKIRDLVPDDVAVAVTRAAGLDLSVALFRAQAQGWRPTPVSIDTFDQETVDEVVRALELDREQVSCLPRPRRRLRRTGPPRRAERHHPLPARRPRTQPRRPARLPQ